MICQFQTVKFIHECKNQLYTSFFVREGESRDVHGHEIFDIPFARLTHLYVFKFDFKRTLIKLIGCKWDATTI